MVALALKDQTRGHHFHFSPLVALCKYSVEKRFSMLIMIFIYIELLLLSTGEMNVSNVKIQIRIFLEIKWRHFLLQYVDTSSP